MSSKARWVVALAIAVLFCSVCSSSDPDSEKWLEDFEHLKQELAAGYSNLEWVAKHNDINLVALAAATQNELRGTSSERKARKIIENFIRAFGDPHLKAKQSPPPETKPSESGDTWTGPLANSSSKQALKAFGYRKSKYDFGIDFKSLNGFDVLPGRDNPFPAGVLSLDPGKRIGVIRIKYFGEDRYYKVADSTWNEFQPEIEEERCNSTCWWQYTLRVRSRLMSHLQQRLQQLQEFRVDAILIDLTGNGGGTEWCEDVARLFTTQALRPRGGAFVKHEHWAAQIRDEIRLLDLDLAKPSIPSSIRKLLASSRAQHAELLASIQNPCDASALWLEDSEGLDCERLAHDAHGQNLATDISSGLIDTLAAKHILFDPIRHPDFVGLYAGPLFVAIDQGTASASEGFATLLAYNEAATTIGERSFGAGCGYTNGGIKVYLKNVKLRIWMPDCVRLRADGENELAGIVPHIKGWDPGDKGKTRARKLAEALNNPETWQ